MSGYEFTRILVAFDGSDRARKALDCALDICTAVGGELTALAVDPNPPAYLGSPGELEELRRELEQHFAGVLESARSQAERRGLAGLQTDVMVGRIPEVVATYAAEHGHHLIVIDHRRSFVGDHLFRSNADRIVERAPCPVMLVR